MKDLLKRKPSPFKFAAIFTSSFVVGYLMFLVIFSGPGFLGAFFSEPISNGITTEIQTGPQQTGEPQFFPTTARDLASIGAMNHQYLQGHTFKRIIIEVDHMEGAEPDTRALGAFLRTVQRHTDKPEGVFLERDDAIQAGDDSYTLREISLIMREYRDNYSQGDTAVIYILYLDGEFEAMDDTLGLALNASSFSIFKDEIGRAPGTSLFGQSAYEEAIMVHEFGHMLGLVNVNYQSALDHEDKNHAGHSANRESVMYWAVESFSVGNFFRGGPPVTFDEADRFDIEQIRLGIY